jgi:hypothetical protein
VPNLCFDSRNRTSSSRKDQIITMFRHQLWWLHWWGKLNPTTCQCTLYF